MEKLCDTSATVQSDPADMQRQVVELLRDAADATGDSRYRTALGVVCGGSPGRPACDDTASLAAMAVMLDARQVDSVGKAARFVARGLPAEHSKQAAAKRLAFKFRQTMG